MTDGAKLIEDSMKVLSQMVEDITGNDYEPSELVVLYEKSAKQILSGLDVYVKALDQSLPELPERPPEDHADKDWLNGLRFGAEQFKEQIIEAKFIKVIHISEIIKEVDNG